MKAKKVFLGLGAVALAGGILAGCSDTVEDVSSSEEVKQTDSGQQKAAKKETKPEDKVYKVGDTVSINGLELTILNAQFTSSPDEYSAPEKDKILTVEVQAVNNSNQQQMVYDGDFNLYDKEDNHFDSYYSYEESPISADLNKGKKATGKLFFDVTDEDEYELIFTTWLDTEIKFDIKPE